MAPLLASVHDGMAVGCGKGVGRMVVGRKEQTWQWLHAVSRFGRGQAVSGISLLMFPAYKKPSWLSWLQCSNLFLWSWVRFSLIANLFLFLEYSKGTINIVSILYNSF